MYRKDLNEQCLHFHLTIFLKRNANILFPIATQNTLWVVITIGGKNLERRNIERPIFRNFKIMNIKITKD